jgi:hypothetical protein
MPSPDPEKRRAYRAKYNRTHKRKKYTYDEKLRKYHREYQRDRRRSGTATSDEDGGLVGMCGKGRRYELLALRLLEGSTDSNAESFRGGWDIIWNGKKIDVKVRNLSGRKAGFCFSKTRNCSADLFLLFCLVDSEISKVLLVPDTVFTHTLGIGVGKSKYDIYKIPFSDITSN